MDDTEKGVRSGAFDDSLLREAEKIARNYNIVVKEDVDGGYLAICAEIALVIHMDNADEAIREARKDATLAVASILEDGDTPPPPFEFHGKLTEQVNVRLTVNEKRKIQQAQKAKGFASLSEYFRKNAYSSALADLKGN